MFYYTVNTVKVVNWAREATSGTNEGLTSSNYAMKRERKKRNARLIRAKKRKRKAFFF